MLNQHCFHQEHCGAHRVTLLGSLVDFWVGTWDRQCSKQKYPGAALSLSLLGEFWVMDGASGQVQAAPAVFLSLELSLRASQETSFVGTGGICYSAFVMALGTYLKLIGLSQQGCLWPSSTFSFLPADPSVTCGIQGMPSG